MKEYKISYFRLSLVLLGYLIYNLVYYMLDYSGGYAFFIFWPIFFLSLAMIVLGNILLFRDIVKLRATYEKNKMIQVTSMIQVIAASFGLCFQLTNLSAGILWPINYVEHYPLLVDTSIIYSVIFIYRRYSKKSNRATRKVIIRFQFSFWVLRCFTL